MKTKVDPPRGHGYGMVEHKTKAHIVKIGDYNATALCGVGVYLNSIIDEAHDIERDVCDRCLSLAGMRQRRTRCSETPMGPNGY